MAETEKNIIPRIYYDHDPDGIVNLWADLVSLATDTERSWAEKFKTIIDPDTADMQFVDLMLAQLGNPFKNVFLSDTQKRKLVKLLIPIYRQKGTTRGIVNAARFMTGIELEIIDPHGIDGWQIGYAGRTGEYGTIGTAYVGGSRFYKNMLRYSEDFDNAAWTKTSMPVTAGDAIGPPLWNRDADLLDLSSGLASLYQAATPVRMKNENFTASIYLKASAPVTIYGEIGAVNNASVDYTRTLLNFTTEWQRFEFHHEMLGGASGDVYFKILSGGVVTEDVHAFGAQLVRSDSVQPYLRRDGTAQDEYSVGRWGYHFFIVSPVALTANEEKIIRLIADFMKPAHTHYDLKTATDTGFVDHWEAGLSLVGVNTYIHAGS